MRLLRQPLMVAYIVAGIVAGPFFLNFLHGEGQTFEALAQFGVVLLLFMVGLSLDINHIKKIGKVSLITGISQVVFTASIGYGILRLLNFSALTALYIAIAITFSSTIIIVKLLGDKKDMQTVYGRHVIGLMVVQDLVAIVIMMILAATADSTSHLTLISSTLIKGLALIALVYILSRYVLPKILDHVAYSSEFLFIFTTAWCFGLASALHWAGFSIEIGAIVAGITLGSSPYQRQISSRVKPLRDFFIVLFFIILGSEMSIANVETVLFPALILSAFILIGNPLILYIAFRLLKFTRRNSFLAGVTAAQVSEFGFILLFTGYATGQLSDPALPIFTVVALVTIFISSYVITYNEQIYRWLIPVFNWFGNDAYVQKEKQEQTYDVWVIGYHRIGWKICESLREQDINFAVIDFNPSVIKRLDHRGIPAFFGDVADIEFLTDLPLGKSKMVISTIPEADDQLTLIKHVRKRSKKSVIVANLYHNTYLDDLYHAGANYVMMPHLLGGQWIAEILKNHAWTKHTFKELKKEQRREMQLRFTIGTHS